MRKQLKYFFLAIGFLTRLPVPHYADFIESDLNHSAKFFPLVGTIVGFVGALSFYLASTVFPQALAVIISMATTIYLTGGFHEDGLADSADGLGGGIEREHILTIMQDSRLGTYGVLALIIMLLTKFQAINALNPAVIPAILILGHALSRLSAIWIMATLKYVKAEGKSKPLATGIYGTDLLIANIFGLIPLMVVMVYLAKANHSMLSILQFLLLTFLPILISILWWRTKIKKYLGGYTGDTLGAMQQITELIFYLGVVAWVATLKT